jgi:hypothetical protein
MLPVRGGNSDNRCEAALRTLARLAPAIDNRMRNRDFSAVVRRRISACQLLAPLVEGLAGGA